jgi:hypothetical protein
VYLDATYTFIVSPSTQPVCSDLSIQCIVISVLLCTELPSKQSSPSDCSMNLLIVPVMKRNCDHRTERILLLVLTVLKSCAQEMRSACTHGTPISMDYGFFRHDACTVRSPQMPASANYVS